MLQEEYSPTSQSRKLKLRLPNLLRKLKVFQSKKDAIRVHINNGLNNIQRGNHQEAVVDLTMVQYISYILYMLCVNYILLYNFISMICTCIYYCLTYTLIDMHRRWN